LHFEFGTLQIATRERERERDEGREEVAVDLKARQKYQKQNDLAPEVVMQESERERGGGRTHVVCDGGRGWMERLEGEGQVQQTRPEEEELRRGTEPKMTAPKKQNVTRRARRRANENQLSLSDEPQVIQMQTL
jgi:hypothetical protein